MMEKNSKIIIIISLCFLLLIIFYDRRTFYFRGMLNNCNTEEILTRVDIFNFDARNKEPEIYSFPGIPSEGIEIRIFDMNENMQVIEVRAFASAVRYYNRYYTDNGNVFYIESITQEWDLEKLYN